MPERGPWLGRVVVVMPCLNEITRIGAALDRLCEADWINGVVVVDGGSDDGSVDVLADRVAAQADRVAAGKAGPVLQVQHGPRGRGTQLNLGAEVALDAGCDVLLFLHVDCALPADARAAMAEALADRRCVGGAFRLHTVADHADRADHAAAAVGAPSPRGNPDFPGPWWLRFADVRSRYTRTPYGDQAIFVRSDAFRAVGGYPDEPLMEDLEFSHRLRRLGRLARLRQEVRVSGRRFLAQPGRSFVMMNTFPLLLRLGVRPATLAWVYGHIR